MTVLSEAPAEGKTTDDSTEARGTLPICEIKIGERFRKALGDIDALARSIAEVGLLHPIVVTKDNRLVAGRRRLEACRRHLLGWTDIPVRVVDIDAVILGEYVENELRKDFTVSERVAITEAVKSEIGRRQGGDRRSGSFQVGPRSHLNGRTSDLAAKRAGFESGKQFERAKAVIEKGAPELVAAVDAWDVSISAGAVVVTLPEPEQRKIVSGGKKAVTAAAKQVKATKAEIKKPKAATPPVDVEFIHASNLRRLTEAWEFACPWARGEFLRVYGDEVRFASEVGGKDTRTAVQRIADRAEATSAARSAEQARLSATTTAYPPVSPPAPLEAPPNAEVEPEVGGDDDLDDIPPFLRLTAEERAAAWAKNPSKPTTTSVAKSDAAVALVAEKKEKSRVRIEKLKANKSGETKKMPPSGKDALAVINEGDAP